MLSEEEIIEKLKKLSENAIEYDWLSWDEIDCIKGLLDLYNKEKEKREIAEENHKVLSLDLGQALKELRLYEDTIIADELVLEINKKYISKDKIKEIADDYESKGYIEIAGAMRELLEERN